jgi:excisionase family DNA binding protein
VARQKAHVAHRGLTEDDYDLKSSEVAEKFRVNSKTVLRWIQQGRLCATETLGGQYRIASICVEAQRPPRVHAA